MSRSELACPDCGAYAPPAIVQPEPRIYRCDACGARTPRTELAILRSDLRLWGAGTVATAAPVIPPTVLQQTLYWAGNPTFTITDNSGSGSFQSRALTAAESHDALDTTYYGMDVPGDFGSAIEGDADALAERSIQTASATGSITRVEIHWRTDLSITLGGGTATGTTDSRAAGFGNGGGGVGLGGFNDQMGAFVVDPRTGLAWTNATINTCTFGIILHAQTFDDPAFSTTARIKASEFRVEIWGPGV